MQEHNPNAIGRIGNATASTSHHVATRNDGETGGIFKSNPSPPTLQSLPGTTTMIINLGEPRPPVLTNATSHQQIGGNNGTGMRTIITNSDHGANSCSSDLLSLLAPISTVMSTSGVILATGNNSAIEHHLYQTQHTSQHQQQQQQHHQHQQHQQQQQQLHQLGHHQLLTELDAQQQQHIVHHLNQSGAIIATTTMNNNNNNNNNTTNNNSSSNSSIGSVHHLGADIQLFQIPITSDNNNSATASSHHHNNNNNNNTTTTTAGGSLSHCTVINADAETQTTTVAMTTTVATSDAVGDTVNMSPSNTQIVYVTSADDVPDLSVGSRIAIVPNNNNNIGLVTKQQHHQQGANGGSAQQLIQQHDQQQQQQPQQHQRQQQHHQPTNQHQQQHHSNQSSSLDDSITAALSMTSEQAESLLNEAVQQQKQDDSSQLNLLSIGGGEQSSYSSPASMDIDLDARLDEEDDEGGYADASSNQSQTQSVIAGAQQQQQQQPTHVSGGSVVSNNSLGGGGYMPLLPPLGSGSSAGGAETVVGTNTAATSGGGPPSGSGSSVVGGGGGGTSTTGCDQTEIKYCIEELCPVCGDKVSGYHYGLLTCESCKGFFKRTVQNKKVYTCVAERQCHIDKTQRKRCPFCRFQKCLDVGMKLEAVRADRMRGGRNKFGPMYKRDRARKLQIMRQRQLAIQTLRAVEGVNPMDPSGYGQSYHMNIKQEIQIPQISSLTSSSPDSSPSPIAIALGQVSASGVPTALTVGTSSGSSSIGSGGSGIVGGSGSSSGNGSGGSGIGGTGTPSNGAGQASSGGGSGGGGGGNSNGSTNSIPSTTTSSAVHNTATDSKQWFIANSTTASPHSLSPKQFSFDSGSNPTSTADSGPAAETLSKKQNWKNSKSLNFPRVSPMIREFVQSVDDREWQQQLFSLLQSQSYNQCEVDVFELMCKVLDQNLFSQVDWARNTVFFKDLKVDDQMKLLQNSWSDMLVLDHLHQRIHNNLADETILHNGQKFDLLGLGLLGVPQLSEHFNDLQRKLVDLKFDVGDYICMKFLLLLNPEFADTRGITNQKTVLEGYENVQAALLDYTLTCYPTVADKFSKLISIIPEIHGMAARGEEHLYVKHCAGSAPTQTLLMEMLHAKRK